jgi:membrane-bound lytic murein transglycosylase D
MQIKNVSKFKLFCMVYALLFVTSCTNPIVKKEAQPTEEPVQQTVEQHSVTSTWEHAYGEPQEPQQNQLDESLPTETQIEIVEEQAEPEIDIWQRIRSGYAIQNETLHPKTQAQLKWFLKHPDYMNRVVERARPYLHYIVEEVEKRDMPMEIALLPVVESGFQPFAYSHGRAAGLWQFIPGTGKVYGLDQNWWYDGRRDVIESTRAALDYLEKLHNDFGDWQLALAAYNCGEGAVGRAIKKNEKLGKETDFWSLSLPRETSAYVPKLMAVTHLVNDPAAYNIDLNDVANEPYLTVVKTGSQIDLALAARLAEMSTDEIYQLNPGYNRWATTPEGPHRLVLPLTKAEKFKKRLAKLPKKERIQWARHKIKEGESLGVIAAKYKTTIDTIKQANDLHGNTIRAGRHLLIPVASAKPSEYSKTVNQRLAEKQNKKSGTKTTHIVQKGDTWWDLATKYNVSVRKLAAWNGKAPADTLSIGQKLVVWHAKPTKSSKTVRTVNYTIRNGDSLWKISQKFRVSVAQVREWNGLSNRTLLKPGQNLTLYVDVTKQHNSI